MKNSEIADIFDDMANVLEFKGANPFRLNAYRKAARILRDMKEDIKVISNEGRLTNISGIGEGIAKKIDEYISTGRMVEYEEAKEGVSDSVIRMMDIPGMGPKTTALVHKKLGINSIEELRAAIEKGKLRDLPGMGQKKEENILRGIELLERSVGRIPLGIALPIVEEIVANLQSHDDVEDVIPAGSLRRMKETIGDIDILVKGKGRKKQRPSAHNQGGSSIIDAFVKSPRVKDILAAGDTKGSVIVENGLQVDLRVVPQNSFGAAMQYFTGSKDHNVKLRDIARREGLKINEYGVFKGKKKVGGSKEEEIYKALGLAWIPPTLREDRGEIEAAASKGKLPDLVELSDIKGDLHVHSTWSDGHENMTFDSIAQAAKARGYEYIVISDHTKALKVFGGLDAKKLAKQIEVIRELNKKLSKCPPKERVTLLTGTEVDIKSDGSLDLPDEILSELDIVVASVHSGFKQDAKTITMRIMKAMENPHVDIIGHPSGRLINERDPYAFNLEEILRKAAETGTAMELNAHYQRLDLDDVSCRRAKEVGVKIAISTDSHDLSHLDQMKLGIGTAQRGWLEKDDVINTMGLEEIKHFGRK